VDGHRCSQEAESCVTEIGDGLSTEGEVGVVGPSSKSFDGDSDTLGTISSHPRPGQPRLSKAEHMLTERRPFTDEGGVDSILQEFYLARHRVEAIPKTATVLGDEVQQGAQGVGPTVHPCRLPAEGGWG
jgi:hypothetical protein